MNKEYDADLVEQFFHEYRDRGMIKWQGFYLSDHTSALSKKEAQQKIRNNRQRGLQMNDLEINSALNHAMTKDQTVQIELLEVNKNMILPEPIQGRIEGYFGKKIIVAGKFVDLDNIYSVEYAE